MSVFEVALKAAAHAVEGTRLGARMRGHRVEGVEEVHRTLRPMRARQSQERAEQLGEQMGSTEAAPSGSAGADENRTEAGSELGGNPPLGDAPAASVGDLDSGVLDFLGGALEWVRDLW